jgi:hypothetical protein
MRRIALILFCAVLLGLSWWRSPVSPPNNHGSVRFVPLPVAGLPPPGPGMTLQAAWELHSRSDSFGGYSTLVSLGDGKFLSVSDRGRELRFHDPSQGAPQPRMAYFAAREGADKLDVDVEGLTYDPVGKALWAGYEQTNRIVRIGPERGEIRGIAPRAMRHWPSNRGPEAILHMADGRFLALEEAQGDWWARRPGAGLLFPGDPVSGAAPQEFRFAAPEGFSPTDIAQLPDGRVLILLRKVVLSIPPRFAGALLLADPADIRPGKIWRGSIVARFDPPLPSDNYEGVEVLPGEAGSVIIWVISDDNKGALQHTFLLKLRWRPPPNDPGEREKGAR